MVSGLVTSPCDQLRIFSGDAMLILMASKSAIGFARSNGLERYKVLLRLQNQWPVVSCQWPVPMSARCQIPGTASCDFRSVFVSQVFCDQGPWFSDHCPLATGH